VFAVFYASQDFSPVVTKIAHCHRVHMAECITGETVSAGTWLDQLAREYAGIEYAGLPVPYSATAESPLVLLLPCLDVPDDVSEAKIRERHRRLWQLVADAIEIDDTATVYDNSRIHGPQDGIRTVTAQSSEI
jgi:hypothetical protein